jgi:solute carrier family 25 phosphate transporter 23/24/25/41
LERLRILQQTSNPEYAGKGTWGSFSHMFKLEGFRGFFKGNGMTMVKIIPFSAAEFFFYDLFKTKLYPNTDRANLSNWQKLMAGGLTGALSQLIVYPTDVVKTYMTVNTESGTAKNREVMTMQRQT